MLTKLYTVYRAELLRYCLRICGHTSDAEDLLQETFMKALSNLDALQALSDKQQRAWLYKVARNLFYDACRKKAVENRHLHRQEEATEGGFSQVEIDMILSVLPPDLADVFIKRYFQNYTSKEIADLYDLSASGVRGMLSRARSILKDALTNDRRIP